MLLEKWLQNLLLRAKKHIFGTSSNDDPLAMWSVTADPQRLSTGLERRLNNLAVFVIL